MTPLIRTVLNAVVLLGFTLGASAHHSFAMFDRTHTETVKGTVRAFEWTNPHCWLWVDVVNAEGKVEAYGFESAGPTQLKPFGITKDTFKPGAKVTVKTYPLKDGRKGGELFEATLEDGTVVNPAKNLINSGELPATGLP